MEPNLKDIKLLKKHDQDTYYRLRNYYINKICYYIYRTYGIPLSDCENLAEDIFVKAAYICIKDYDPFQSRFMTWILNIAKNECVDFIRKNQYFSHEKPIEDYPSKDISHTLVIELKSLLEEQEFKCLILYALYDYSISEIADSEKITRQTVYRKLQSAKRKYKAYKEEIK